MSGQHHNPSSELKRLPSENLTEIDPTPVAIPSESPESAPVEDSSSSNPASPPTSASVVRWLQAAQKYSSYTFAGFFAMHVASVIVAPSISIAAGDSTMQFTGAFYQNALTEPWLVYGSLGTHIVAGTALRMCKIYKSKQHYGHYFSATSSLSPLARAGYVLTPFVLGHVGISRVLPQWILGDSSLITLEYISHSFADHPIVMWACMVPLVVLSLYHVAFGFKRWLQIPINQGKNQTYAGIGVLSILGLASLTRLSLQGPATGWVASQFNRVLSFAFPVWLRI